MRTLREGLDIDGEIPLGDVNDPMSSDGDLSNQPLNDPDD